MLGSSAVLAFPVLLHCRSMLLQCHDAVRATVQPCNHTAPTGNVIAHGRLRSIGLRRLWTNHEEALQLAARAAFWQDRAARDQRSAMMCYLVALSMLSFPVLCFGRDIRRFLSAAGTCSAS